MDSIAQNARSNYRKVKEYCNSTEYHKKYAMSTVWNDTTDNFKMLIDTINGNCSAKEAIQAIENTYLFSIDPPGGDGGMVEWHMDYMKSKGNDIFAFDERVQSSHIASNVVKVKDRVYSPDFFRMINFYLQLKNHCILPQTSLFVELGGGYGNFARTRKLFFKESTNVMIDLPESLFFCQIFLSLSFPEAKILYVSEPMQLTTEQVKSYDFVFIPTVFAESIAGIKADLFANTASLGEMSNPTIEYWINFIQTVIKTKYCFMWNRYLNIGRRDNENECSVIFDRYWKVLNFQLEPDYSKCPFEEPKVSRSLELILEREDPKDDQFYEEQSAKLLYRVSREWWHDRPNSYGCGSYSCNEIAPDLSINGTLFKLWESIRLHKTKANIHMMLTYLARLKKKEINDPFEEVEYYERILGGAR